MKHDQFIKELITALSQTSPLPEPEELPEKTENETIVGDASPAIQALVLLYIRLEKSKETATGDALLAIEETAALVSNLSMSLANFESENPELPVSGFVKGWKLAHDPDEYISVFVR